MPSSLWGTLAGLFTMMAIQHYTPLRPVALVPYADWGLFWAGMAGLAISQMFRN